MLLEQIENLKQLAYSHLENLYPTLSEEEIVLIMGGSRALLQKYLGNIVISFGPTEIQWIKEQFFQLVIKYCYIDTLTMIEVMKVIKMRLSSLDKKNARTTSTDRLLSLTNNIPQRVEIIVNGEAIYSSTEKAINIFNNTIDRIALLGESAFVYLNNLVETMLLVEEELIHNPTFLPAPFFIANFPLGVSIYALRATIASDIGFDDEGRQRLYATYTSVISEIMTDGYNILQGMSPAFIEAPREILLKVFGSNFAQKILKDEFYDEQIIVKDQGTLMYKEISSTGEIFTDEELFKQWFWQILFNAATVEETLQDVWSISLVNEQIVATRVDNLPAKINEAKQLISKSKTVSDVLAV